MGKQADDKRIQIVRRELQGFGNQGLQRQADDDA